MSRLPICEGIELDPVSFREQAGLVPRPGLAEKVNFAPGMLPAKAHGAEHWAVVWAHRLDKALGKLAKITKFDIRPAGNVQARASLEFEVGGEKKTAEIDLFSKDQFSGGYGRYAAWCRVDDGKPMKAGTRALAKHLITI